MSKISFLIVLVVCFITASCSTSDEEAKMAADTYAASMEKFDVSSLKVSSSDDFMASNISISSNLLLSDEEKQQARNELWERYYFVSIGGNEDNICFKRNSCGYLYNNEDLLKNLIDKSLDRHGKRFINKEFDKLVNTSKTYKQAISMGWCSSSDFKNNYIAKVTAIYCFTPGNKLIQDAIKWISVNKHLIQNQSDIISLKEQYIGDFLSPVGDIVPLKDEKSLNLYAFKYYSYNQLLQMPTFNGLMNGLLDEVFEDEVSKYQCNIVDTMH